MKFTAEVEIKLYEYYCDDCSENFYLKTLSSPSIITCPHCGDGEQVSISSSHLSELMSNED